MGSVELLGHYGSDETHALSAWTSTRRELTDERRGRVDGLLRMLAENGHHTPFEKSTLHFLVRCETASHIHLLKHRIGVSVNGESARYKQVREPSFHVPDDWPDSLADSLREWCSEAQRWYEDSLRLLEPRLGRERAKESARFFLPYASELTLDVSFNFRSLMHFAGLRCKPDAQREIRLIGKQMIGLVAAIGDFDNSLAAFGYS